MKKLLPRTVSSRSPILVPTGFALGCAMALGVLALVGPPQEVEAQQQIPTPAPLAAPTPAPDPGQALQAQRRVLLLLSSIHELPSLDRFRHAAPDPQGLLLVLAADPHLPDWQQARAFEALAEYWPDDQTLRLFRSRIEAPDCSEMVRHRLLLQAARGFGDRALPLIAGWTGAEHDERLQLTAIEALTVVGSDGAAALLRQVAHQAQPGSPVARRLEDVQGHWIR